jgi:hypothetical protein
MSLDIDADRAGMAIAEADAVRTRSFMAAADGRQPSGRRDADRAHPCARSQIEVAGRVD